MNPDLLSRPLLSARDAKAIATLLTEVLAGNNTILDIKEDFNKGSPCGSESRCSGNGVCQGATRCVCSNGFSGVLCQYKKESLAQIRALTEKVI